MQRTDQVKEKVFFCLAPVVLFVKLQRYLRLLECPSLCQKSQPMFGLHDVYQGQPLSEQGGTSRAICRMKGSMPIDL